MNSDFKLKVLLEQSYTCVYSNYWFSNPSDNSVSTETIFSDIFLKESADLYFLP